MILINKHIQGNNRNHASYYAYGLPVQESEVKDTDPYLYSGKEFYSLRGVNLYDFNARTYAPDIARFMQPDPLATENHGVSPYIYCNGDPINFIDPTGEKVYFVNGTRRIISEEEAGSYNSLNMKEINAQYEGLDVVIIIDKDGKIIRQSETFDEGTIKLHDNSQSNLKGKDITMFEIIGEEAGRYVFEALSQAITARNGIEFGYIRKGTRKKGLNVVFTDHNVAALESMWDVFYNTIKANKQPFVEINHSHKRTPEPSSNDLKSKKQINDYLRQFNKRLPNFLLYVSDVPLYIDYQYCPKRFGQK